MRRLRREHFSRGLSCPTSSSHNRTRHIIDQLCSSVTNFLNDEAAKADADAKACKDRCGWKKRKDDLLNSARKKARESCSKGEAPDVDELSKGLDRNTKDRLKDIYNRNSRMFDGTAKLKSVDFNAASSKDATVTGKTAALGKGGQVTDLKSAEPAIPKLNAASEFSLSGPKLSGDTSNTPATKQSPILLASAAQSNTSAKTVSASAAKSPGTAESDNTSGTPQDDETISQEEVCAQIAQAIKNADADWVKVLESDEKTRLMCAQASPEIAKVCYASADATKAEALQKYEEVIQGLEKLSYEAGCGRCTGEGQALDAGGKCCPGLSVYKKNCVTICEAIKGRIADITWLLAKWKEDPEYEPLADPNWQPIALTSCDKDSGPHTVYFYEVFKALDPVRQKAVEAHEDIHQKQCIKPWYLNNPFIHKGYIWNPWQFFRKGWYVGFEVPAYKVEKQYLEDASKNQCK